jgi:DNA modification methylase
MTVRIITGDCRDVLKTLPPASVHTCVTSPPYWGLRDYGVAGQIGSEATVEEWVDVMVAVFREVKRVLRDDGTVWLNLGDAYSSGGRDSYGPLVLGTKQATHPAIKTARRPPAQEGIKPKDLIGMPWMVAFALRADGWYLRSDIIWAKPNPMPESVRDRPTSAHEHVFLLTKRPRYFYDADAVRTPAISETTKKPDGWDTGPGAHGTVHRNGREKGERVDKQRGHGRRHDGFNDRWDAMPKAEQQAMGANLRNVWTIATHPFPNAHFATFPPALVEPCIKAGTSEKGCCGACGAPWVRQTKPTARYAQFLGQGYTDHESDSMAGRMQNRGRNRQNTMRDEAGITSREVETTGWSPTCTCAADTIPCTVLDPFGGAGTTGLVADRLGRDAILIELNPSYVTIGADRVTDDAPLFAAVEVKPLA